MIPTTRRVLAGVVHVEGQHDDAGEHEEVRHQTCQTLIEPPPLPWSSSCRMASNSDAKVAANKPWASWRGRSRQRPHGAREELAHLLLHVFVPVYPKVNA
jgi:hypothetical protein